MNQPAILTKNIRDGLVEEEHFGFIVHTDKNKILSTLGDANSEPFYLRSCAKPLQASVIVDYELDFNDKEIALACGSNAGEKIHENIARELAGKIGIKESDLKCGTHKPLSPSRQEEMILKGENPNPFQNNCIGKHLTMLALCKKLGFDIRDYDNIEHPVQQIIKNKVNNLCQIETEYPITKDGCGVPILSMPLENIVPGFLDMFCDEKYSKIKHSILENPYFFGGETRTDTKIIQETGLISKVGAGGLCVVINLEIEEGFIVKISDCDMKAREIVTFEYIKKLGWGNYTPDKSIKTLHNETVGEIKTIFDYSPIL
ncbi:asparaginase [bacterium]|nr:asparaginase [bacterium]